MAFTVQMPALGESVTEGTVTRWLKQEGDRVEVDEPLLEVSTDKVDTEIPSPAAGVLERIVAGEDETVEVGGDLAVIGDGDGGGSGGEETDEAEDAADDSGDDSEAPGTTPGSPSRTRRGPGSRRGGAVGRTRRLRRWVRGRAAVPQQGRRAGRRRRLGHLVGLRRHEAVGRRVGRRGSSVTMPELGESVTEGTVTRWLKQVGDTVEVDEPLLEVSTDKVDTEIPSPVAGTLLSITVDEDETVQVGAELAVVGDPDQDGGSGGSGTAAAPTRPPDATSRPRTPRPRSATPRRPTTRSPSPRSPPRRPPAATTPRRRTSAPSARRSPTPSRTGRRATAATAGTTATGAQPPTSPRSSASSPRSTTSTWERLRVGRRRPDPQAGRAVRGGAAGGPEEEAQEKSGREEGRAGGRGAAERRSADAARRAQPTPAKGAPEPGSTVKMPRLRQVIAQRMTESLRVSAQLTTVQEVDVTRIARLRAQAKAEFERREGVKLTYLPFFAKATVEALKQYPQLNASIDEEGKEVTYHGAVHLAIAVDTPRGLLVPVIPNADELNIAGLARHIADLAARTRDNKVGPNELSGGTFTITNIGSSGALFDTPIINQPQVAILGTGAISKEPKVIAGADGEDVIAVRSVCYLPLTYDHRLVDGADAGRFVTAVRERLEEGAFEADLGL